MPNDKHVKIKEVPPILINGNVNPVAGTNCTETEIFANALMTISRHNPMANIAPKALGLLVTSFTHLMSNQKYIPKMANPPIRPYSSHMMA